MAVLCYKPMERGKPREIFTTETESKAMSTANEKSTGTERTVCPFCFITVAPYDPYKKVHEGRTVHGECLTSFEVKTQRLVYAAGIATACTIH